MTTYLSFQLLLVTNSSNIFFLLVFGLYLDHKIKRVMVAFEKRYYISYKRYYRSIWTTQQYKMLLQNHQGLQRQFGKRHYRVKPIATFLKPYYRRFKKKKKNWLQQHFNTYNRFFFFFLKKTRLKNHCYSQHFMQCCDLSLQLQYQIFLVSPRPLGDFGYSPLILKH